MAKYDKWLQDVVNAAEEVMSCLGEFGYTEPTYEEALSHELRIRGIPYERQRNFELLYKGYKIGMPRVDYIIDPFWATGKRNEHALEIKAVKTINESHKRQAQVYMISLNISSGAVLSMHRDTGVQAMPLDKPAEKPVERKVQKLKSTKTKPGKEVLKKTLNVVHKYLGTEFIYREGTGLTTYQNAFGIELRLSGIDFSSATYPISYKGQEITSFSIPYVFNDNTAFLLKLYRNEEDMAEAKEENARYAKQFGIRKIYLGFIPQKEDEKAIIAEA